jgi:hypothetical protein
VASKALDGGGLWLDERYDAAVDVQIPLALMWALYASDLHLCDCMLRAPEGLEGAYSFRCTCLAGNGASQNSEYDGLVIVLQ